jgi:hypothetical protein
MYCQNPGSSPSALSWLADGETCQTLLEVFTDSPLSVLGKWLHKLPLELRGLAKLQLFLATYGKDEDILTLRVISESIVIEIKSSASRSSFSGRLATMK